MKRAGWLIPLLLVVTAVSWFLLTRSSGPMAPAPTLDGSGTAKASDGDAAATLIGTGHEGAEEDAPTLRLGRDVIRVRVVNRDGQPVSGTPVQLSGPLRLPSGPDLSPLQQLRRRTARWKFQPYGEVLRHVSDANGSVRFEGLQNRGAWRVMALTPAPLCVVSREVPGTNGNIRPAPVIELVLLEGVPLELRLVDAEGAGLPGFVEVTAPVPGRSDAPTWTTAPLETDAEGRVRVQVPPGVCSVCATVPGHGVRSGVVLKVPYAGVVVIAFEATDLAEIFGRVLHPDGSPVGGASLWVRMGASGLPGFVSEHEASSDEVGRYRITGVAGTRIEDFTVRAAGHLIRLHVHNRQLVPPGGRLQLDLLLPRGCGVEGRVVDPAGQPLAGATVQASPHFDTCSEWFLPVVATDAGGAFRLDGVPPGRGQLIVRMPGCRRVTSDGPPTYSVPEPGDRQEVLVTLLPGAEVRGVVLDAEGRPAVAATVALGCLGPGGDWFDFLPISGSTISDREGHYVLSGFDPDAALLLRASTDTAWSEDVLVPKGAPAGGAVVDLALRPGARVAGQVVQGGDVPWPPRGLRLTMGMNRRFRREVLTDADGRFAFEGLPQGKAHVAVMGLDDIVPKARVRTLRRDVALVWGQEAEPIGFELPRLGRIGGRVLDAAGAPIVGAMISLRPGDEAGFDARYGISGFGGAFEFHDLPDVPYMLSVAGPAQGPVHIGEQDLEIQGTRETVSLGRVQADLRGRVYLPDGRLLPRGTCTLFDAENGTQLGRSPLQDGMFTIQWFGTGTKPEHVRVQIDDPMDLFGIPCNVLPGPLDLAFPSQGLLEVHLAVGWGVAGRLVTENGEAFVPGIVRLRLTTLPAAPRNGPPIIETIALTPDDSEVRFSFVGLPPGRWTLEVLAGGHVYTTPSVREVSSGLNEVEIRLQRGMTITGRLLAPGGGAVEGAMIIFEETQPPGRAAFVGYARSREDGRFEIVGVPVGATGRLSGVPDLATDAESLVVARQHGVRSGAEGVVLQLQAGAFISGRIDLSAVPGREPDGIQVWASPVGGWMTRTFSGKGPAFRIGPMPAGVYELEIHPIGDFPKQERLEVRAPAQDVVLAIQGGVRVEGKLRASAPWLFDVSWQWRGRGGKGEVQFTRPQVGGRFAFWVPANAVPGTLFVRNPETGEMAVEADVRPVDGPFRLTPTPGLEIRGRVAKTRLYLRRIVACGPVTAFGRMDDDGQFEVTGLPAGRYDLSIESDLGGPGQVLREGVAAGSTGVVLGAAPR